MQVKVHCKEVTNNRTMQILWRIAPTLLKRLFEMEPHYRLKILLVILARSPGPLPSKILQDSRG